MSLPATFRFELAYQARRVWPWLVLVVLAGLSFLMTRDGTLAEALLEDFFVNSPFAVAKTTVVGGLAWLLMAAGVAGDAGARDVATRMHPLVWTAPVSKTAYLGGRFLAALVLNAVLLLAVQAGILLGVYVPGVEGAVLGPFRPAAWIGAYAFLALPTAFAATAIQFALATRSGRVMSGYMGSLLLLFMGFFVASMLLFRRAFGALLDPVGIRFVVDEMSHDWTTYEKSWRLIELEGTVLGNRLLWLGVALAVLGLTWARFRFAHRVERAGWIRGWWRGGRRRKAPAPESFPAAAVARPAGGEIRVRIRVPAAARASGWRLHARQTLAIAWRSFRSLAITRIGLLLLVLAPLLVIPVVIDQMYAIGSPLVPTTGQVLQELTAPLTEGLSRWVIVPLFVVFFAGELVWRERDAGLDEITDAMPGSEWPRFLGKLGGLWLVLALFTALQMAAGIVAQTILGHSDLQVDYQLGLYLQVLFGFQLSEYLLFAVLALAVHTVVDRRYVGYLVAVLAYVYIVLHALFGVHHDLLVFGTGPSWVYTDMRGLGPYVAPWAWFKLYWAGWALLLAVVARLFWSRGREGGFRTRLRLARRRLTPATLRTGGLAAGLVLAVGGFVFYNTNVLHDYASPTGIAERKAEYERRYGGYARLPQPSLARAELEVEIHPERRELDVRGSYRLVNRSDGPIGQVHLAPALGVETDEIAFDRPATPAVLDEELGYRIYDLETPLEPGDSLRLGFRVRNRPRGFREDGADLSVTANGTYFTHDWLPAVGYQRVRELLSPGSRREHGLPERPVIPSLHDDQAPHDRDGGVVLATVLGTAGDQVAVAPGALRREWREDGRRYFEYETDGPIGLEWAFASARYAVEEAVWEAPAGRDAEPSADPGRSVEIRVFHHPEHAGHLEHTLAGIRASLDYYTERFGPYPYGHLTVAEIPGDGVGVHSDPGMLTHGEGYTLLRPRETPGSLDMPFAVMAHEMGHQWAVPAAYVEGAPVLAESLAWYQALKVVEHARGPGQVRRVLAFMRLPFPYKPIHRGEPLLRGLDPYLSYRKGPFALWALDEYLGGERVNRAIERLLARHRPDDAPLATTLDLYRELEAVTPERYRYLLHDLFEVNTVWELRTEGVTAEETGDGGWRVSLDVTARKVVHDEQGGESEVPLDEEIPVGVFAADPKAERGGDELGEPLHVEKHRIRSGEQTITITLPPGSDRPVLAGIDPYHLLDWEEKEDDDNLEGVELKG